MPQLVEQLRQRVGRPLPWRAAILALGCVGVLVVSERLGAAADGQEQLGADVSVRRSPSATVRVTDHAVPSVAPNPGPDQPPRTLLDLFSSWMNSDDQDSGSTAPAVKVEPRPVQGRTDLVVVPEGAARDAIVPIDPAPESAAATLSSPTLAGAGTSAHGQAAVRPEPEPMGVLTMRLVSTSLVSASLWGRSVSADDDQGDELDHFASVTARSLDLPSVPASRSLLERARPPLKAGRVITNQDGIDLLLPVEPAAAPAIN